MNPGDLVELAVDSLAAGGAGVGRVDGRAVFVEGAYPGETVTARVVQVKKRYARAESVQIDTPSPYRIEPACPYVDQCGGCPWMGLRYDQQLVCKERIVADAFSRIGKIDAPLKPIIAAASPLGYRARVRLKVAHDEPVRIGYRQRGSGLLAAIGSCAVATPAINQIIATLPEALGALGKEGKVIDEIVIESGKGQTCRITLLANAPAPASLPTLLLEALPTVDGVALLVKGERHGSAGALKLAMEGEAPLAHGPGSFVQANQAMNITLARMVTDAVAPKPGEKVADFYCGVGNYSLPLALNGAEVVGIDNQKANIDDAKKNGRHHSPPIRPRFIRDDAWQAAKQMATSGERFSQIVVNPPRSGLKEAPLFARLAEKRLVYVSCDPGALARDARLIVDHGFAVASVTPVDLFPHTPHVETVAVFDRIRGE